MPRRVFLDVGAHEGQTLAAVIFHDLGLDLVHCFEPARREYQALRKMPGVHDLFRPIVMLHNYGLAERTGHRRLYGTNRDLEASIWRNKDDLDRKVWQDAKFRRASEFFDYELDDGDQIILKLNCEGAETLIVNELIGAGQLERVHWMMLDLDVTKVAHEEHRAADTLARLAAIGFDRYTLASDVPIQPDHATFTRTWIEAIP